MTEKNPYQPISCAQHDTYEIAIMRKQNLYVTWHDETNRSHSETLTPTDVTTRDHAEYLIAKQPDGTDIEIRLDYIKQCELANQ